MSVDRHNSLSRARPSFLNFTACYMSIALDTNQIRFLRKQAHDLKAWMQVGEKGISPAFLAELGEMLERHELLKIKVGAEDRQQRADLIAALVAASGSVLVQRIGHVAVIYKPANNQENRHILLPKPVER